MVFLSYSFILMLETYFWLSHYIKTETPKMSHENLVESKDCLYDKSKGNDFKVRLTVFYLICVTWIEIFSFQLILIIIVFLSFIPYFFVSIKPSSWKTLVQNVWKQIVQEGCSVVWLCDFLTLT